MNEELQDKIKQLCESKIAFGAEWKELYYDAVYAICEHGYSSEDIENLPMKQQTIFPLLAMYSAMDCDGFFSIFYNNTLHEIKRLRHSIGLLGLDSIGNIFDEAFQLVESKFTWSDEHVNFATQVETFAYEYFGKEISDRFEEWEKQVYDFVLSDKFAKHLESYLKSTK